jgi:hypothetical protein
VFPALYTVGSNGRGVTVPIGSLSDSKPEFIVAETNSGALCAQGFLVFLRENTPLAQSFDVRRLTAAGEAAPVAEHSERVLGSGDAGIFAVSENGLLILQQGSGRKCHDLYLV